MTTITNETTGQEIHLIETNDIDKLKNQLKLLGINGLFYSPWAKKIQEKIAALTGNSKHPESCECDECELDYQSEITALTGRKG